MIDLDAYFARITDNGDRNPTLATLRRIHRAHLMHIPFENLNIHIPEPIILDEGWFFSKIVTAHRGGFCFEQNGLFCAVLDALGYEVYRLEANVRGENDTYDVPLGHMCLLVVIDGVRYLADVGFGASFIEPLAIDNPAIQEQDAGQFRISFDGNTGYFHSQTIAQNEMQIAYRFYLTPHTLSDYGDACHYMQTSPHTHFTQKRVCSQWTHEGRVTVSDDKLIITTWDGNRTETPITSEEEFHALLNEHFNISVQTRRPGKDS